VAATTYAIPVSNGLLASQHRQKIGSAIWLFLLFIDWTTEEQDGVGHVLGGKPIKVSQLMEALALEERQVRKQLQRLKTGGYIVLSRTPRGYSIDVLKSKKWCFRDRHKSTDHNDERPAQKYRSQASDRHKSTDRDRHKSTDLYIDTTEETIASQSKKTSRHRASTANGQSNVPGYKAAMATYHDRFVSRFGAKPDIDGRDGKLLSGLIKTHGAEEVTSLLEYFFESPPAWVEKGSKYTIPTFKSAYTEILAKSRNGRSQMGVL
jgi:hypothetical protein